jgi:hypothetical protein
VVPPPLEGGDRDREDDRPDAEHGLDLAQEVQDLALEADLGHLVALVVEGNRPAVLGPVAVLLLGFVRPAPDLRASGTCE